MMICALYVYQEKFTGKRLFWNKIVAFFCVDEGGGGNVGNKQQTNKVITMCGLFFIFLFDSIIMMEDVDGWIWICINE